MIDDFFKLVTEAKSKYTEMLFWNYQYVKRKALQDNVDNFQKIEELCQRFSERMKPICNTNLALSKFNFLEIETILPSAITFIIDFQQKYFYRNIPFHDIITNRLIPHEVIDISLQLWPFATEYSYTAHDITAPNDTNSLLKIIEEEKSLPLAPPFHINKNDSSPLSQEALTILRLHPRDTLEHFTSPWETENFNTSVGSPSVTKYAEKDDEDFFMYGIYRNPNFVALINTQTHDFDFTASLNEISGMLAMHIYNEKKDKLDTLTPTEQKAVINFFEKQAQGHYGPAHSQARATGLWLWDYKQQHPEESDQSAIKKLKESDLSPWYSASDDRTLRRLLESTRSCINSGKVLPINKRDTKKKNKVS